MNARLLIPLLLLGACARTEPAETTHSDEVESAVPSPTAVAPAEEQTRPGDWEASAQGGSQAVTFRGTEGEALFTIGCDERGGLVVQRPGLVTRGNLALLQLRTGDTVRRLAATTGSGSANEPQVQATVPYNDQLISALMRFDQPLEVRFEGLETLILPPNPLVSDLVRTCQRSTNVPVAAQPGEPAANAAAPAPAPAPAQAPPASPTPAPARR